MLVTTTVTLAMPGLAPPLSVAVPWAVIGNVVGGEERLKTCLRVGEVMVVSGGAPLLATTNLVSATGALCWPSRSTASA